MKMTFTFQMGLILKNGNQMKIREINAMRGPNYWSVRRHKLIVLVLDLEDMEERPSNLIEGFSERLEAMFPTMYEHRCSEGVLQEVLLLYDNM